jgi:hypothetical protein
MAKAGRILRSMLVWTHGRGTLQYDIICALILAFIFLVPKSCFVARKNIAMQTRIQTGESAGKTPQTKDSTPAKRIE